LYVGFDPTADSLHVGSLVPLLALRRFQLAGHHPIAVAGGATGSIGDPSGKSQEWQLLTREVLDANIAGIKEQLKMLLDFENKTNPARLLDGLGTVTPLATVTVRVSRRTSTFTVLRLGLPVRLYSGKTASYRLRFDLVDPGGAPIRDLRIGDSLVSFPVCAASP
jgi:tyrosyl-tRNA synthetase